MAAQFERALEEDLTCSICLSTFHCPVTIPCGHNFCSRCLLATWAGGAGFCCPQCRAVFPTRPDLKKNTVLSTIVENLNAKLGLKAEPPASGGAGEAEGGGVLCDTCMEAPASSTCLTCMAAFCEEHLKPHRINPVFSLHQLVPPVQNLFEWTCQKHHKLLESFCGQHGEALCSLCLQQEHRGCCSIPTQEQRSLKEVGGQLAPAWPFT